MKLINFAKKEPVLSIAALAALISCFFVRPDREYISYMDFRTLALLYCLMLVVEGLSRAGIFKALADFICRRSSNLRILSLSLVMVCFFSAMLITNDVALITFVPFAVLVLTMAGAQQHLIWVVIVQTIAANLGSMLTPVGNPQNLYLFSYYNLGFGEFFGITMPVWILSLAVCVALCFKISKTPLSVELKESASVNKKAALIYAALFIVCLLVVFRFAEWYVMLAICMTVIFIQDKDLLKSGDYILLLTFVCFFVFSGNLARMESVKLMLENLMKGREFIVGALASQCISNVPAALLLSSFTDNAKALILGTDIGGLGTPIASMASLISYKLYCSSKGADGKKYMAQFLLVNFVLLAIFCAAVKLAIAGI